MEITMEKTPQYGAVSGQRPPLDDTETVAIPRPANELDGQSVQEKPDEDREKAG
jgi:hypothetical protein